MQSYPFTSDKITYDEHGLPKYDRAVDSAFLRKVFAQYFSDGVFYSSANALQVVADTGMQVAVEPGSCHIQGAIGIETNRRTLVVQAAEEMDRIDTVVARLDLSRAVRSIDLYVVKGTAAESPQAPALTRDSTIWELGLANLFVAKNVATISQQRITDTRLDTSRCGQVGAPVQPPFDTEAFFSQLEAVIQAHQEDAEAQIEQLRNAIEAVEGDAAWMMKEHYDPAGLGKDITVQTYTHSKSGTVHEFTGTGANGRAKMTADVQAGDTFTVNGAPVTAYMGTDDAAGSMAGSAWNGKWVSFIVEGGTLNFKGGGGKVTVTGLTADAVKKGTTVTVKQGAKVVASVVGNLEPLEKSNIFLYSNGLRNRWNNYTTQTFYRKDYCTQEGNVYTLKYAGNVSISSIISCAGWGTDPSEQGKANISVLKNGSSVYSDSLAGIYNNYDVKRKNATIAVNAGDKITINHSSNGASSSNVALAYV